MRRGDDAAAGPTRLCVLTQNVWGGIPRWSRRRQRLAQLLDALVPDVIGLQEIHWERGEGGWSQAHELAELVGGYEAWFAPGRVAADGSCEGVALLVREDLEVLAHSVEALTLDRDDPHEGSNQRIVLRAAVRTAAGVIDVLVTHLSLSRQARVRTALELSDFAARERAQSGSVGAVLMGDFNELPREEAIAILERRGWVDAWKHLHPRALGGTWPAGLPFRRIDYVFFQPAPDWRILDCRRMPIAGSDHLGLAALVDLGPARARFTA